MNTTSRTSAITVFGAYGHTGRFVAAELRRRGWTPILAGRDEAKLRAAALDQPGSELRVASVEDPGSLDRALDGAAAVINCAGPFGDTTPPLIAAALRAGVHYLDVTGEALVAMATFEEQADRVRAAGLVALPAVGFFGALGDLLATVAMGSWSAADEVSIAIAVNRWWPTPGTRLAGERRAGRRIVWREGSFDVRSADTAPPSSTWEFPAPFGRQEMVGEVSHVDVVTIPQHLKVRDIHAYLNLASVQDLRDPATPAPVAIDESGRSAQTFHVQVVVRNGDQTRRASARGRDIYAITGPIVVEAAERLVDGRFEGTGVAAVGAVFDAADFLKALSERHLTLGA